VEEKTSDLTSACDHGIEKVEAACDVIAKILRWILHRLGHQRIGGEMHHRLWSQPRQSIGRRLSIGQIALDKFCPGIYA
jgi:hypothetical protein